MNVCVCAREVFSLTRLRRATSTLSFLALVPVSLPFCESLMPINRLFHPSLYDFSVYLS